MRSTILSIAVLAAGLCSALPTDPNPADSDGIRVYRLIHTTTGQLFGHKTTYLDTHPPIVTFKCFADGTAHRSYLMLAKVSTLEKDLEYSVCYQLAPNQCMHQYCETVYKVRGTADNKMKSLCPHDKPSPDVEANYPRHLYWPDREYIADKNVAGTHTMPAPRIETEAAHECNLNGRSDQVDAIETVDPELPAQY